MALPLPPLRERRVFVDSSVYLALLDQDDEHHRHATQLVHQLAQARYRQFTTNVLLIESHALILSVLGRAQAAQFLKDMEESNTVVIRVRASDEARARQILFQEPVPFHGCLPSLLPVADSLIASRPLRDQRDTYCSQTTRFTVGYVSQRS
jgi:predicted nucleic acid-binding protein